MLDRPPLPRRFSPTAALAPSGCCGFRPKTCRDLPDPSRSPQLGPDFLSTTPAAATATRPVAFGAPLHCLCHAKVLWAPGTVRAPTRSPTATPGGPSAKTGKLRRAAPRARIKLVVLVPARRKTVLRNARCGCVQEERSSSPGRGKTRTPGRRWGAVAVAAGWSHPARLLGAKEVGSSRFQVEREASVRGSRAADRASPVRPRGGAGGVSRALHPLAPSVGVEGTQQAGVRSAVHGSRFPGHCFGRGGGGLAKVGLGVTMRCSAQCGESNGGRRK